MMGGAERVSALLNRVGQMVTYKRVTGQSYDTATGVNTVTYTDYSIRASIREYSPRDIQGAVRIGDRKAQIAGADIAFTPAKDDKLVIDSLTWAIVSIETRKIGEDACLHILQIRGAGA